MKKMEEIDEIDGEEFREIGNYPGYFISNMGRCWSEKTHKFIGADSHGYVRVGLSNDDGKQKYFVHKLVLQYFGPPQPEGANEIDHINHIRDDNRIENLRWVTRSENDKNRSSHLGVQYEYFDEIPADDNDIIDVRDYGSHEFENLYYADEFFYFDNGVNFRQMHINFTKRGLAFVWAYDINGKRVPICYTKFKQLYGLD